MHIIDRRLNPGRQELRQPSALPAPRARAGARAVREASTQPLDQGRRQGRRDFAFPPAACTSRICAARAKAASRDYVLPGNKKYIEGDAIPRPEQGGGQGRRRAIAARAKTNFASRCRTKNISISISKTSNCRISPSARSPGATSVQWRQAGYSASGPPSRISVPRTLRHSMSRRIALKRPKAEEIDALREEIEQLEREGGHFDELVEAARRARSAARAAEAHSVHRSGRRALSALRNRRRSRSPRR